jgi:hypothetical protein
MVFAMLLPELCHETEEERSSSFALITSAWLALEWSPLLDHMI